MKAFLIRLFVTVLLLPALSACGIKPGDVDPPPHVEHDTFPQRYPPAQEIPDNGQ